MSKALDSSSDKVRLEYALTDVIVNSRITPILSKRAEAAGYFKPLPEHLKPAGWDRVCAEYNPGRNNRFTLLNVDQTRQMFCNGMHEVGVPIDVPRVRELVSKYRDYSTFVKHRLARNLSAYDSKLKTDDLIGSVGDDDDNNESSAAGKDIDSPSVAQVEGATKTIRSYDKFRDLLYNDWQLDQPPWNMDPREFYTDSGLPGTNNAVLLAHMASGRLTPLQLAIINDARIVRRVDQKIISTVLDPLLPESKKSLLWPDERLRSTIRAFLTAVGRYSSVNPNMQNFGNKKGQEQLPSVFACRPGRMFIGFDVNQIHIVIMANHWKIQRYIDGFVNGTDAHIGMAEIMVGKDKVRNADGWGPGGYKPGAKPKSGEAKAYRDTAKPVGYAYAYLCLMREAQIKHAAKLLAAQLSALEIVAVDKNGDAKIDHGGVPKLVLPYLQAARELRPGEKQVKFEDKVEIWITNIFNQERDWNRAWQKLLDTYRLNKMNNGGVGYMESYYFKRRSGNLSDGKAQEVVNNPILASEQDIMAIKEFQVVDALMTIWAKYNPQYMLQQHDAVKLEVDDPAGPNAPRCMYPTTGGWSAGHKDKKDQKACPHCQKRDAMTAELEEIGAVRPPGEIPYTDEGHWGWTLADL